MIHQLPPTGAARRVGFRVRRGQRPLVALAIAATALLASGCQTYQREPLDLASIREAWLARSPDDDTVRVFAERLATDDASASTASFNVNDGLTLAEAEPVALVFNRTLRLARSEASVSRAEADHAGRWEDPVIGVDFERIVSGVADPWVAGSTVGLTIPISGRLAAERDRAGVAHAAELARLAALEWSTRAELRERWIEWSAQRYRLEIMRELIERLRLVVELAERHERAGVLSRIDARILQVELASRQTGLIAAQSHARQLELELRDLLGLSPEAPVQLVETIGFSARETSAAGLRAVMESGNADLAAAAIEYDLAEQTLRLEVRKQFPDLTIGPGLARDQGEDHVLLGLQFTLPLWNRNRQGVARALAERDAARTRFESDYQQLCSRLAVAWNRYETGRELRRAVETHVLPLADLQDAEVRRTAELGRVDTLVLLQAMQTQYEAKIHLAEARMEESIAAIRLDELFGPPSRTPTQPAESSDDEPQPTRSDSGDRS